MSKEVLIGLKKNHDLLEEVVRLANEHGITKGVVRVIGALTRASLAFYHQSRFEYEPHEVDKPVELLTAVGSISLKDGKAMAHLHLTLSDETGAAFGGHAMPGCLIFAAECHIREVEGAPLVRGMDEATGLPLWK